MRDNRVLIIDRHYHWTSSTVPTGTCHDACRDNNFVTGGDGECLAGVNDCCFLCLVLGEPSRDVH